MAKPSIRVLCVEDHRIVREGIALIIDTQRDMKVVASASTGEEALMLYRRHKPDVTLMDLQLPGISGLEAIRQIRKLDDAARIVVLTMYEGDEDIHRALQAGARTYLLKDTISDDLINVIRRVSTGERPLPVAVQTRLAERDVHGVLTNRELQVMELIGEGLRNKEIAAALGISEETTQVHVKNILLKLKVHDRTAAVRIALRRGFIHMK
jgi:two-component system NarL family response regulator